MGSDHAKREDAAKIELAVGENIGLRAWRDADAGVAWKLINAERDRLGQWLAWVDRTLKITDVADFIVASRGALADGTGCDLALIVGSTVVGGVGLCDIVESRASLGYWISGSWQRLGIMTKAARAILAHGFGALQLDRIEIWALEEDSRGRALAGRLGFVEEGILRRRTRHRGNWHDCVVHGMLKDEFL
jgi:ribosomal-protein-serine acetyltransferase